MALKLIVPPNYYEYKFAEYNFISSEVNIISDDELLDKNIRNDIKYLCEQPITFLNVNEVDAFIINYENEIVTIVSDTPFLSFVPISEDSYIYEKGESFIYSYEDYVENTNNQTSKVFEFPFLNSKTMFLKIDIDPFIFQTLNLNLTQNTKILTISGIQSSIFKTKDIYLTDLNNEYVTINSDPDINNITNNLIITIEPEIISTLANRNISLTNTTFTYPIKYVKETLKDYNRPISIFYNGTVTASNSLVDNTLENPSIIYGIENVNSNNLSVKCNLTDLRISTQDERFNFLLDQLNVFVLLELISNSPLYKLPYSSNDITIYPSDIVGYNIEYLYINLNSAYDGHIKVYTDKVNKLEFKSAINLGNIYIDYKTALNMTLEDYNKYKDDDDPTWEESRSRLKESDNKILNIFNFQSQNDPIFEYIYIENPSTLNILSVEEIAYKFRYLSSGFINERNDNEYYATKLKAQAEKNEILTCTKFNFNRINKDFLNYKAFTGDTIFNNDPRFNIKPQVNISKIYTKDADNYTTSYIFEFLKVSSYEITQSILDESGLTMSIEDYRLLPITEGLYYLSPNIDENLRLFEFIFNPISIDKLFSESFFKELIWKYEDRHKYLYFKNVPVLEGATVNYSIEQFPYVENFNFTEKVFISEINTA